MQDRTRAVRVRFNEKVDSTGRFRFAQICVRVRDVNRPKTLSRVRSDYYDLQAYHNFNVPRSACLQIIDRKVSRYDFVNALHQQIARALWATDRSMTHREVFRWITSQFEFFHDDAAWLDRPCWHAREKDEKRAYEGVRIVRYPVGRFWAGAELTPVWPQAYQVAPALRSRD